MADAATRPSPSARRPAGTTVVKESARAAAAQMKALSDHDFWALVDMSLDGSRGDSDLQAVQLRTLLEQRPAAQIVAFQTRLAAAAHRLYAWRYEAAGDLLCGSLGVDGFTNFRTWVVSRGKAAFTAALANPDSLAPLADELRCPGAELFGAAAVDAYHDKTGHDLADVPGAPVLDPTGPPPGNGPFTPIEATRMFPRLAVMGRSLTHPR